MEKINYFEKRIYPKNIIQLVDMLSTIKYELFFGAERNISYIAYFIIGYLGARIDLGLESEEDRIFNNTFSIWVCNKYSPKSIINWVEHYKSLPIEEDKKIELFYKDFKDFFGNVPNGNG